MPDTAQRLQAEFSFRNEVYSVSGGQSIFFKEYARMNSAPALYKSSVFFYNALYEYDYFDAFGRKNDASRSRLQGVRFVGLF